MRIVWDEPKRQANLDKHGLDFANLTFDFILSAAIAPARDGRFKAIGHNEGGMIVVIFAVLGTEAISIVSMRPASERERRLATWLARC